MLEGVLANNVPNDLKKIFPNQTFMEPENKPGIYVCYFPHNDTVYVGMSKEIKTEIGRLQSRKEKRPRVIESFSKSGKNVKTYSILQGKGLENEGLRRQLEIKFINIAGPKSINIDGQNKLRKFT